MNTKQLVSSLILSFLFAVSSFSQGNEVWKDIPYPKEANGNIKCIETDPQGNVWVGTEYGSLLKFDGKTWTSIDLKSTMNISRKVERINTIFIGENNTIWVGTDFAVFYFDGNKWDCLYNSKLTKFITGINNILSYKDETWFLSSFNIYKLKNSKWTVFSMYPNLFRYNRLNDSLKDISNVHPLDTILYEIDTNLSIVGIIQYSEIDDEGNLWYTAGEKGLVKFDGLNWINFSKKNSTLPFESIYRIKKDRVGHLWCLTYGNNMKGIHVLEDGKWIMYSDSNNFDPSDDNVRSILQDNSGNVWIGLDGGMKHRVIKFTGKSYKVYNETNPISFGDGIQITIDKNGTKWFASAWDPIIRTLSDGSGAFFTFKPKLKGKIYFDKNKNKQRDPNEPYVSNHRVKIDSINQIGFTNSNGEYEFSLDYGSYNVAYLAGGFWKQTTDSVLKVTLNDSIVTVPEIGVFAKDTAIFKSNFSFGVNRCGFEVPFYYTYNNAGTIDLNGILVLKLDTGIQVKNSVPMYDSIRNNIIYYSVSTLKAGEEKQIKLSLKMPDYTRMGEQLKYHSKFKISTGIFKDSISSVLKCAYDPNEKEVSPTGVTDQHYTYKNDKFTYTLRFQNIGNDTAVSILVQDTLNKQFDLTTFEVVASSHKVQSTLDTNRVANFLFKNILLPDSTTNEIASHGFVTFSIKRSKQIKEISDISNTGYIYFDYNPAVVTNTTKNTLVDTIMYKSQKVCNGASFVFDDGFKIENITNSVSHVKVDTIAEKIELTAVEISPYDQINVKSTQNVCHGMTIQFGTQTIQHEGIYKEVFTSKTGCDSTVVLTVLKDSINTTIESYTLENGKNGFIAKDTTANYQWFNCKTNTILDNEIGVQFVPKEQGSYALQLTKNTCVDTSECYEYFLSDLENDIVVKQFKCYPNPSEGELNLETISEQTQVEVIDLFGRVLKSTVLIGIKTHTLHFEDLETNFYTLRLTDKENSGTFKINLTNNK